MKSIREIFVEGSLTQKKFSEPLSDHVCSNCGTAYKGYYCPMCGQKFNVSRLSFSNIFKHAIENIVGFTPNLPRTLLDLLYRPGYLVKDYLQQKRCNYSNPFSTVLLLATIYTVLSEYVYHIDLAQSTLEFGKDLYQGEAEAMTQELTAKMMTIIYGNYGIFLLTTSLIAMFPIWLSFRGLGKDQLHLNLCESLTVSTYFTCISMLVALVFEWMLLEPGSITFYTVLTNGITLPLFVLMLRQLFPVGWGTFLFRLLLFFVLSVICYIFFSLFWGIIGLICMLSSMINV